MHSLHWLTSIFFIAFASAVAAQIDERCLKPHDLTQTNPACVENFDACSYIMGFGTEFGAIQIVWLDTGDICGWHYDGTRMDGTNFADGKLSVRLFEADTLNEWGAPAEDTSYSLRSAATLEKSLTESLVIWEGTTIDVGNNIKSEPVFLQRARIIDGEDTSIDYEDLDVATRSALEAEANFRFNEGHGAYYCGDGGCDDNFVYVQVEPSKAEEYLSTLRASNFDVIGVEWAEDNSWCAGFHGAAREDLLCSIVEAIPLRSPEVTMQLREIPGVVIAYRSGGAAGADATSFFLSTNEFLKDERTMDGFKAATVFDGAIRSIYPNSALYEFSEPEFSDNSLKWEIVGRSDALQRIQNPSREQKNEWWKVRVQLAILQKNAGDYFLSLGLPETKVTTWGFSSTPSADKFATELTNDPRFLQFRNRLMSAIARGVPGEIFIP